MTKVKKRMEVLSVFAWRAFILLFDSRWNRSVCDQDDRIAGGIKVRLRSQVIEIVLRTTESSARLSFATTTIRRDWYCRDVEKESARRGLLILYVRRSAGLDCDMDGLSPV
jgi:hypothetical protein